MCSNYRPASDKSVLRQLFGVAVDDTLAWPDEAHPLSLAPAIWLAGPQSAPQKALFTGQFGLLPHWAKNPALAKRTYNARVETAHDKSNFKDAWRKGQRCIIPAECIFEANWQTGKAERWKISRTDGSPFGIAGLWSRGWAPNGAEVLRKMPRCDARWTKPACSPVTACWRSAADGAPWPRWPLAIARPK